MTLDENTKDSVGSDNFSGGSGHLNEDSNLSFPGDPSNQDENSNDSDMKLGGLLRRNNTLAIRLVKQEYLMIFFSSI